MIEVQAWDEASLPRLLADAKCEQWADTSRRQIGGRSIPAARRTIVVSHKRRIVMHRSGIHMRHRSVPVSDGIIEDARKIPSDLDDR
jgi:hypothetical protein